MQFQSFKEILPHWELSDFFTVIEAAALMAGFEPSSLDSSYEFFWCRETGFSYSDGIREFEYSLSIVTGAIDCGMLSARIDAVFWERTVVSRTDLINWILGRSKRFRPAFFFPEDQDSEGFTTDPDAAQRLRQLEAENARLVEQVAELQRQLQEATEAVQQSLPVEPDGMPDELWIANTAFRAVSNGYRDDLSTPKKSLEKYLSEHYPALGVSSVGRIATMANPDKTPGRKPRTRK